MLRRRWRSGQRGGVESRQGNGRGAPRGKKGDGRGRIGRKRRSGGEWRGGGKSCGPTTNARMAFLSPITKQVTN